MLLRRMSPCVTHLVNGVQMHQHTLLLGVVLVGLFTVPFMWSQATNYKATCSLRAQNSFAAVVKYAVPCRKQQQQQPQQLVTSTLPSVTPALPQQPQYEYVAARQWAQEIAQLGNCGTSKQDKRFRSPGMCRGPERHSHARVCGPNPPAGFLSHSNL